MISVIDHLNIIYVPNVVVVSTVYYNVLLTSFYKALKHFVLFEYMPEVNMSDDMTIYITDIKMFI